ncbi:hypothetical protein KI387_020494, partial [Taxus chinensis]
TRQDSLSVFIYDYAINLMDMELEEVVLIFKGMHAKSLGYNHPRHLTTSLSNITVRIS